MANDCAVEACTAVEPTGYMSESWPWCRSCSEPVCAAHVAPETLTDADEGKGPTCLCLACKRLVDGLTASANLTDQWNLWHVAESVLSPSNENLLAGDLVACFRDVVQELVLLRSPVDHGEPGR